MNKIKITSAILAAVIALSAAVGCAEKGGKDDNEPVVSSQIANPWKDADKSEADEFIDHKLAIPEDAEDVSYQILESEKLLQIMFTYQGTSYTARVAKADEFKDISGIYVEKWDDKFDDKICGEDVKASRSIGENEQTDLCLWYDKAEGNMYSLSVTEKDLAGFDITAMVHMLLNA